MGYKSEFQSNNTDLQEILDMINALGLVDKPKLSSIAVAVPPAKTEYKEGEVFDPAGMVVTASYSDGSMKVVTGYTIINGDQIAEDMTTVTISYTEDGITATTAYEVGFVPSVGGVAVGNSVYLNVNGARTEFLIVHQGLPSSLYDISCNGTWLLMKDVYLDMAFDSADNDYQNSDIHTYLNETFFGLFEKNIQSAIQQVKIPYHKGVGNNGNIASGPSGLSAKIFLLSGYEVGFSTSDNPYFPVDGAKLDYFLLGGSNENAKSRRLAYLNGSVKAWRIRSPMTSNNRTPWFINTGGGHGNSASCTSKIGIRPALVLPSGTPIDSNLNVMV